MPLSLDIVTSRGKMLYLFISHHYRVLITLLVQSKRSSIIFMNRRVVPALHEIKRQKPSSNYSSYSGRQNREIRFLETERDKALRLFKSLLKTALT